MTHKYYLSFPLNKKAAAEKGFKFIYPRKQTKMNAQLLQIFG
jgi:hypothetical protein